MENQPGCRLALPSPLFLPLPSPPSCLYIQPTYVPSPHENLCPPFGPQTHPTTPMSPPPQPCDLVFFFCQETQCHFISKCFLEPNLRVHQCVEVLQVCAPPNHHTCPQRWMSLAILWETPPYLLTPLQMVFPGSLPHMCPQNLVLPPPASAVPPQNRACPLALPACVSVGVQDGWHSTEHRV